MVNVQNRWLFLRSNLIILSTYFIFSLIIFWKTIFLDGVAINSDYAFPNEYSAFIETVLPLWNNIIDKPTIEQLPNLPMILLIVITGTLFNLPVQKAIGLTGIILSTASGYGIYYLVCYCFDKNSVKTNDKYSKYGAFFAGLVYLWSPFVVGQNTHLYIRFAHGLLPYMVISYIWVFEKNKRSYCLLTAFLWLMMVGEIQWIIYTPVILLTFTIFWFFFGTRIKTDQNREILLKKLRFSVSSLLLVVISFVAYSAFWFLPGFFMGGINLYGMQVYGREVESFPMFYRNAIPSRVIRFMGQWVIDSRYQTADPFLTSEIVTLVFFYGTIIAFVLAVLALRFYPKEKYPHFFSLLAFVNIFMLLGPYINVDLFRIFLFELPFSRLYSWAFRTPKYQILLLLAVSVLAGYSCSRILVILEKRIIYYIKHFDNACYYKKCLITAFFSGLIVLQLLASWPLFTGDFNGSLTPIEVPEDMEKFNKWLKEQEEPFKMLWVPRYYGKAVEWNLNRTVNSYFSFDTPKPLVAYQYPTNLLADYAWLMEDEDYQSLLLSSGTEYFGKIIASLGVKYIILHDDLPLHKALVEQFRRNLISQKDLMLLDLGYKYLEVFENLAFQGTASISSSALLGLGNLVSVEALATLPEYHPLKIPLIFIRQNKQFFHLKRFQDFDMKLLGSYNTQYEDLAFLHLGEDELISVGDHVEGEYLWLDWTSYTLNDPYLHRYVYNFGFSFWEIPFGTSSAVSHKRINDTGSDHQMTINYDCKEDQQYEVIIRKMDSFSGGKMTMQIDDIFSKEINTLLDKPSHHYFNWEHLGSVNLTNKPYSISISNLYGINIIDTIVIIPTPKYEELINQSKQLFNEYPSIVYFPLEDSTETQTFPVNLSLQGKYRLSYYGNEPLDVSIGNSTINLLSEENTGWQVSTPFQLNETAIDFSASKTILSNTTQKSYLWLYSIVNDSETLDEFLNTATYQRVRYIDNNVKITASLDISESGIMVLTMNYNDFWQMKLGNNEEHNTPLITNVATMGYAINATGTLDIIITLPAQKYLELGSLISIIFMIGSLLGLITLHRQYFFILMKKIKDITAHE